MTLLAPCVCTGMYKFDAVASRSACADDRVLNARAVISLLRRARIAH